MRKPRLIPTVMKANWIIAAHCSECRTPILHTDPKETNRDALNQQLEDAFQKHIARCPAIKP